MRFIMFKGKQEALESNTLFGCLVSKKGFQFIDALKKGSISDLEPKFNLFVDSIVASIILKESRLPCHGAYELVAWGSSKKDAGKTLLFYILNHGITIIADRMSVSEKARSSIMSMAQSKFASALEFKPLDNFYRKPSPVTPDTNDDCVTFTNTGGYASTSSGGWASKMKALNSSSMSVDDYMDFAVAIPKPRNFPASAITQKEIDLFSTDKYGYLTDSIRYHFDRKYKSRSIPLPGVNTVQPDNLPPPPPATRTPRTIVDPSFVDSLPPPPDTILETVSVTRSKIRKMIIESLIKHTKGQAIK